MLVVENLDQQWPNTLQNSFLKVCMARSAAFAQWLCGDNNCQALFSFESACFKSLEHLLSIIQVAGFSAAFFSLLLIFLHPFTIVCACQFFKAVTRIALASG